MGFKPGKKTMIIHSIGENTMIQATSEGRRYTFMYSRTLWKGEIEFESAQISFSDNLQVLLDLKEKETQEYESISRPMFTWEKSVDEYDRYKITKSWKPERKGISAGWVFRVEDK